MNSPDGLGSVIEALRDKPEFLAGWLAQTPGGDRWLTDRLGLDQKRLERLLLSRAPRPSSFRVDVEAVAQLVTVRADTLALALREGAALAVLSAAAGVGSDVHMTSAAPGLLVAARDDAEETISRRTVGGAYLRRLAQAVRARAPHEADETLDVESVVAWAAPLAVVILAELSQAAASGWLHERGVALGFGDRGRALRGLLLAWRGSGVIFVDGSMSSLERRFTVAHELGHFLLDYVEPRTKVLHRAPDLVAVLDGHRNATAQDRTRAVLEGLRFGVHTHLLERDPHGGAAWDVEQGEDMSSRFAVELLSPWNAVLASLRGLPEIARWHARLEEATRLIGTRFQLPDDAARTRARAGLESIGKGPGFLDR